MKRILLWALALTLFLSSALAESYAFGSFELAAPKDVEVEEYENYRTIVRDQTRIVVQVIPQELAEDGQAQVRDLMTAYNENITDVTDVPLISGLFGAMGLIEDRFDAGVHEIPVLILKDGELLILSGYNDDGDTLAVHTLLTELLTGATLVGEPIIPTTD